jgi:[acyl-carrier-protein] S-malonyltransferase
MAVSVATYRAIEDEGGFDVANDCRWVAGHSLGEYSALTAVGSLSIGDAARLLRVRGRAMQAAVPVGLGGMAALPLTLAEARAVADEAAQGEVCVAANDNGPNQVVLSGALQAIKRALGIAAQRGAKRSVLLPVSAPFHCELMAPAARAVEEALSRIRINDPRVPLISNVTASAVERADDVRRLLVQQITSMVRWRETMLRLLEQGIHSVVEVGAGRVLSGLARRFDRNLHTQALATPEDIRAFIGSARTST